MKHAGLVVVVLAALLIAAPVVTAGVQFLKVTRHGTGTVDATLPAVEQSRLTGLILSAMNTGTIPSGAYWCVRLRFVDGERDDCSMGVAGQAGDRNAGRYHDVERRLRQ
jgi:hypothetical protein